MSEKVPDELLVKAAQGGDNAAMERLCERYKDGVRIKTRPYFLIGADRDDLLQEGMIGLYKAIRDYRDDHNASFASFADMCINRQVISAIKASRRQKHQPLNSYVSLYSTPAGEGQQDRELIEVLELADENPEDAFITKETSASIRKRLQAELTPLERRVTEMFLEGMTYQQIADRLGCGKKSVDNALCRVKKKLSGISG